MAIQTVDLTVPNGDTPRSANTKINSNFTDQANAASRLVGSEVGKVPLAEQTYKTAFSRYDGIFEGAASMSAMGSIDNFKDGTRYLVRADAMAGSDLPSLLALDNYIFISSVFTFGAPATPATIQTAQGYKSGMLAVRAKEQGLPYSPWKIAATNPRIYSATTASGANVAVDVNGVLMRSTSSEQYKNILAPLVLDDARYADAMALKPIIYRSTADADNPLHHYYSFSAEELGAFDPAFTLWRTTEIVTDADGVITEQPLAVRQAEGININALLAMSHAISVKQNSLIADLQEQINALKPA